nr:flagellar basal body rod protein FlgB [Rhodoblastus sphagnicola]
MAVFSLASQRASWLSARETTIASNVANANTPGYNAQDVTPFSSVLSHLQLPMARTAPGHIQPDALAGSKSRVKPSESWDVVYSGNSVNLEQEMLKAGEVGSAHALDVAVVRSFHQMLMNSVKA